MNVLALQETYVRQEDCRILGYVGYHSTPQLANKRACASVYVQREFQKHGVGLSEFCFEVAEYVAATIRLYNQDVSVYVCPGSEIA